jgi:hypothetical protein
MGSSHPLKITLKGVKPAVWRRLLIPSEYTLARVHEALLTGMGWSGDPLYAFRIGHTSYLDMDEDWPDDSVERQVHLRVRLRRRLGTPSRRGGRAAHGRAFPAGLPGRASGLPTGGCSGSMSWNRNPRHWPPLSRC